MKVMSHKAMAYYSSAADDEISEQRRLPGQGSPDVEQLTLRMPARSRVSSSIHEFCVRYQRWMYLPLSWVISRPSRCSLVVLPSQSWGTRLVGS